MRKLAICLATLALMGLVVTVGGCDEDKTCAGCLIEGVCHEDLAANPANPCQVCDVSVSAEAWTDADDGAACDDGLYCNGADTCEGGSCSVHGSNPCYGIGLCDEDADDCGGVCDGCLIGSECHADGDPNPEEVCEICDVGASASHWTNNDGVACDDDRFCNGADTCEGGSCSVHAGDPCTPPEMCDESADACDASCSGCLIGTTCFGDGNPNPANVCEICDVASSSVAWTANDGASCEDGDFCTGTDTCVGAVCEHSGDPCDPTETCDSTAAACVSIHASCVSPIVVTGDATFFGPDFELVFGDDQDLQHSSCDPGGGLPQTGAPEAVFQLELGPGESVNIREDGGLDALIMVVSSCDDTAPCLVADDVNEDSLYTASATEIVHVIVSATVAAPTPSDYNISFHF